MQIDSYVSDRHRRRKRRRMYLLAGGAILVFYLLIFGVVWFILRSPFFRVENIVVQGNSIVASDEVISLLQSNALHDHSFLKAVLGFRNMLIWPDELPSSSLALAPQLASVTVSKDYFSHTLTVSAVERTPFGVWCFNADSPASEHCYWFDNTGDIFERAFDTQGNIIFVVHDHSQKTQGLNGTILPEAFRENMISVMNVVRATGLVVSDIELKDLALQEVNAVTAAGPVLKFSLRFPAENYLPVIKSIAAGQGFSKLQYIDCRTENRVYYQ